jgi:acetylornithine/LysW-gamma-L-lysine aminotransferase|tara:strand:+ start:1562 stop:2698 length:1137 start_codon:yes stop_codon:yes gene_type:complete
VNNFIFSRKNIQITHGNGVHLYDTDGTEYLDLGASYACVPAGHNHPHVLSEIQNQLEKITYIQGSYPISIRDDFYNKLVEISPGDVQNIWLSNSGTEANEAAIKFARHATQRSQIISTKQAFHGRTMGSLSATWKPTYKKGFEPLIPDVDFVTFGDVESLTDSISENTAAVIVEPIQGEGGVNLPPPNYLQEVRKITEEVGAAMILDEIQTGLGRTGSFWNCNHTNVVPDILTSAKGLANGLPIGVTLCKDWIAENPGNHGSTFSGGPVVCAAGNATIDVILNENLPENASKIGSYLLKELKETIGTRTRDIRGSGLLLGIEVKRGSGSILGKLARDHGILALPAGKTVVRILPPLTLDRSHADDFISAMDSLSEDIL